MQFPPLEQPAGHIALYVGNNQVLSATTCMSYIHVIFVTQIQIHRLMYTYVHIRMHELEDA